MQERVIKVTLDDDMKDAVRDPKLMAAIAYLAMWGNSDYVEIHSSSEMGDRGLMAHHYRKINKEKELVLPRDHTNLLAYYTIGAVRDKKTDEYDFHS